MTKSNLSQIWSISEDISYLCEIIKGIDKENPETPGGTSYLERTGLAGKINQLTENIQQYEETIEKYADFLEAGAARKQALIIEIEEYADKLEAGVANKKLSTESAEEYADRLELGAVQTHEFAEKMEEYANRLEMGVAERMKELAEIGEAVASLSHCIKNIVNNLKAGSYVIEKGIEKEKPELVKRGWGILGKNIMKMSDLALDMLAYSKKRTPDYEEIDINSLVEETTDFFQEKATSLNIKIHKEFDQRIKEVCLEPRGIYRCLLNFISNSIDACENMDDRNIYVKTSLIDDEDNVRIDITDTGCGMSEETKEKLFTTFFSTKGSKGTGLGLPTSYKIIKEHGGTIEVESKADEGTTFSIILPIEPIKESNIITPNGEQI